MKTQNKSVFAEIKKKADSSILMCAQHLDELGLDATTFLTVRKSPKYCITDKNLT